MPLALRFILPPPPALFAVARAAQSRFDGLVLRWFVRDLDIAHGAHRQCRQRYRAYRKPAALGDGVSRNHDRA